jgi:hypothetical protein
MAAALLLLLLLLVAVLPGRLLESRGRSCCRIALQQQQ